MRNIFIIILLIFVPAKSYAAKLKVVTSFTILQNFVSEIAGDKIELTNLLKNGGDMHNYQPNPTDIKLLSQADLIIVNGLGFEGWIERILNQSPDKIVIASNGIDFLKFVSNNASDPHAWQNVSNAKIYVANIAKILSEKDPKNKIIYETNLEKYLKKLDELDFWIRKKMAEISKENRKVITTHSAFQYYAKAYDIEFIAPLSNNDGAPSATAIARLIDQIRSQQVKVIFFENAADQRLIKQLQQDTAVYVGGTLYADSSPYSYIEMMIKNTSTLIAGIKH